MKTTEPGKGSFLRAFNSVPTPSRLWLLAVAAVAALAGSTLSARAALLAYEGFDYAADATVVGGNGGFGFSAAWLLNGGNANNSVIRSGSFSYTDQFGNTIASLGNRILVTGDGSADGDNTGGARANAQPLRALTFARGDVAETTWVSLMAIRTGLPFPYTDPNTDVINYGRAAGFQYFYQANPTSTAQGNERFAVGRASQNSETDLTLPDDTWGVWNRGAAAQTVASSVDFTAAPADFLLMRIDHAAGNNPGNDTAYLWINPANLAVEPSIGTANVVISANLFDPANDRDYNFNQIRLFGGSWNSTVGYGSMEMDEFKIGTTFLDVTLAPVPEPSAVVLASVGGLVLLWQIWRRRK
jgi:hypothetical protein